MRLFLSLLGVLAIAACETPVPDSGSGVGFDDYSDYRNEREAELSAQPPLVQGNEISSEAVAGSVQPLTTAQSAAPVNEPAPNVPAPNRNNAGISDEQDFSAVSSRQTIESDAQRRAAQQQAYQVIAPTTLPTRNGRSGASIVEFALSTSNQVGQSIYRRSTILAQNRFQRNCAKYSSPDRAQEAFLKAGGPKKDSKGLDPDGDGFACFWDPAPYRTAVGG